MSYIVGCDFDTKAIHLVAIDENDVQTPEYRRLELEGGDAFMRTRSVRAAMMRGFQYPDGILAFGIEHPAGTHGSQVLMRVQGAILACLPSSLLVQDWPPGKWRKAVGLPGNCPKDAVAAWATSHGASSDWCSFDSYDAYTIAVATQFAIERQTGDGTQGTPAIKGSAA